LTSGNNSSFSGATYPYDGVNADDGRRGHDLGTVGDKRHEGRKEGLCHVVEAGSKLCGAVPGGERVTQRQAQRA